MTAWKFTGSVVMRQERTRKRKSKVIFQQTSLGKGTGQYGQ